MSCFKKEILSQLGNHDLAACEALKAYHNYQDYRDQAMFEQIPFRNGFINGRRLNTPFIKHKPMDFFACEFGTTIEEMKKHWRCVPE